MILRDRVPCAGYLQVREETAAKTAPVGVESDTSLEVNLSDRALPASSNCLLGILSTTWELASLVPSKGLWFPCLVHTVLPIEILLSFGSAFFVLIHYSFS